MRSTLRYLAVAFAMALALPALAQNASNAPRPPSCYPSELRGGTGTEFHVYTLDTGYVACWRCGDGTRPLLAGDVNTVLRNVGDRLDTVKAASSPAAVATAASASWSRNVTKNVLTDPVYARMRDELRYRQICGFRPAAAASAPT